MCNKEPTEMNPYFYQVACIGINAWAPLKASYVPGQQVLFL